MTNQEKRDLKEMVEHLVGFYNLDLRPRGIAQKVWFDHGLHEEIVLDYLRFFKVPAKVRLIKTETRTMDYPNRVGFIEMPTPCPHFTSQAFKNHRFVIRVAPDAYESYEQFVCVLTHELSHLVLYSTMNKYHASEVATDVLVILYGLEAEFLRRLLTTTKGAGYITDDQTWFVSDHLKKLRKRRAVREAKGFVGTLKAWLS